jgi:hypothetical protein
VINRQVRRRSFRSVPSAANPIKTKVNALYQSSGDRIAVIIMFRNERIDGDQPGLIPVRSRPSWIVLSAAPWASLLPRIASLSAHLAFGTSTSNMIRPVPPQYGLAGVLRFICKHRIAVDV